MGARVALAVMVLGGFAWLIVTTRTGSPISPNYVLVWALRVLLVPIGVTIAALLRGWFWGRWMGLAAGLAVLPWGTIMMLSHAEIVPAPRDSLTLLFCVLLLMALLGRPMFEAFEGRSPTLDWRNGRMTLVRWTIITNIASACSLYLFAVAYEPMVDWYRLIPGVFLVVLITGAWLLVLQKTLGLLLVAGGSIGLIPAGALFLAREARDLGEVGLFLVLLVPGVLLGSSLLIAFGKPLLRYVRQP